MVTTGNVRSDNAISPTEVCSPPAPLAWAVGFAAAGIIIDRFVGPPFFWWIAAAVLSLISWALLRRKIHGKVAAAVMLLAIAALAGAWHHACWSLFAANDIGHFARAKPYPTVVEAIAVGGCRYRPEPPRDVLRTIPEQESTELTLRIVSIRDRETYIPASGICTVKVTGNLAGIEHGDRVRVFAMLVKPNRPMNPGDFDFRELLRSRRQLCFMRAESPASVIKLSSGSSWNPIRWLHIVRRQGVAALAKATGASQAPLAGAVLFGAREQLDADHVEGYFVTGSVHLLAISGLHVGILAYAVWLGLQVLPISRRTVLLTVTIFVVAYAFLTDARPPVVRAAVLVSSFCLSRWTARPTHWLNTLSLAGLIVLAINPTHLFQAGAQLSFLAVGSLAATSRWFLRKPEEDPLDRLVRQSRPWMVRFAKSGVQRAWRLFLMGTIIWIACLPLVMLKFHLVSPIALLLNPILIPLMGFALVAGLIAVITVWVLPPVGMLAGSICGGCLAMIEFLVQSTAELPYSYFWTPGPSALFVGLFYVVSVAWLLGIGPLGRVSVRWMIAGASCWFAVAFALASPLGSQLQAPSNELNCTFLSVGHGTSVCLELPGGKVLLYDAGRLGSTKAGVRIVSGFLWSRNKSQLDGIIISHADADHYNAIPGLLNRFPTAAVYYSPMMFRETSPALNALQRAITDAGGKVEVLSSETTIAAPSNVNIEVLHPPAAGVAGSDNANSIVLLIEYQGRKILLPGDVEAAGLQELLASPAIETDVTMAPHHGSIRSQPAAFAEWCEPQWVVVSGGDFEDSAAAVDQFKTAGAIVLHTDKVGAVRVTITADELRVRTWLKEGW